MPSLTNAGVFGITRITGSVVGESNNPLNQVIQVHGIICPPDGPRCWVDPQNSNNYEENVVVFAVLVS